MIGVSTQEVDTLVEQLQNTEGVLGARMMGGGFGGMILVLVETELVLPDLPLVNSSNGPTIEEIL
jgi:galactokinase